MAGGHGAGGEGAGGRNGADRSAGTGRLLRFASERKCLASPGELSALDGDALRRYLAFQYVPPPAALTPPIRVLPPGHAMIARPGGSADVYRYWRADLRPARAPSPDSAASILSVMRDSIAVHLRSDAPLGAFLSGGIDSAAICALAAEHRPDLLTFTVGFEREGYSEIDRAQETAAALGVKSIPYVIGAEEFFTHLPRIIWHLDDPMADAAAVPLWFVAREASKHVKVVLSGEGSDELFGGYAIYHQPGLVRAGERLPELARFPLKRAAALIPAGVKGKGFLQRTSTPLRQRYIGNAHVFIDGQVDMIARPRPGSTGGGLASAYAVTDPVYDQAAEAELDDVSTMQLIDINTWLAGDILVKADRMTMAHSLELRVPFLDREVMAVASRLAREEKIGGGTTKLALREAMSTVLPQAAAERAKLGFPVPIGFWLKGEMYGFAERLLREARTDEWIDRQAALSLLERFRAGDADVSWRHIWVLVVFSLWHQIYVERVYDPAALGWERVAGPSAPW
jgi:asparagine synthase (glutamine-hydrolysing)